MRRTITGALLALLAVTACSESTGPERHSLLGRWRSEAAGGVGIEMVLSESARSVTGAGRFVAGDTAVAFGVTGTNTGEDVSLLFEFGTAPTRNFLGTFIDRDTLEGTIVGAGTTSQPALFVRVEEDD